jgi:Fanconi anemia group D2 protein
MADSSPVDVQREIITALPQSIDDRATQTVTEALQEMLSTKPELTVPVLDALSNLDLDEAVLDEVRDQVLDGLDSYGARFQT